MHLVTRFLLYLLVFLTGAAGLVYQIVWHQYLARILGSEHAATAIVLAVFLGGLAVGYLVSGGLSQRVKNPLATYATLEGIIGVWALAFPFLFRAIDSLTARWSFAPPGALAFQGSLVAIVLIGLPTICMGGTVPLLTRALSVSVERATAIHARVYAVNTLGAFLGALAAGFLLVPWLGLPATLRLAAVLNLAAALFFHWRSRVASPAPSSREPVEKPVEPRRYPVPVLYAVAFLSGAYVMTLENVLIRVTDLSLGTSTSSFALIVGVFVLCIGIGSLLVGAARRLPAHALVWNQICLAAALLAVFLTLDKWPCAAHVLRVGFQHNIAGFWWHKLAVIVTLTLLLVLPIALAGATLPIAFHELRRDLERVGWFSGRLFFWNLVGAVLGSLIGGWLLYNWMDNGRVFLSAVLLAAVSALLAAGTRQALALWATVLLLLTVAFLYFEPMYQQARFAVGTFRLRAPVAETWLGPSAFYEERMRGLQLLHYEDGPAATVAVLESDVSELRITPEGLPELFLPPEATAKKARAIFVNGKSDSNTHADRETLRLLADLGGLLAGERKRALVIGLGTGVTAGELALDPDWEQIVVAELAGEVAAVLPLFSAATHEVQNDPRLDLRLGDAFRVLRRSPEKWDMIASEPSNLWVRGTPQLFSREFYRMARSRLQDDGVFVQWMHAYGVDDEILGRVGATLRSEFASVTVFRGTSYDYLFVATARPLEDAAFAGAAARMQSNPRLAESLREIGIMSAADLRARQLRPAFLRAPAAEIETLDRPALHDLAGKTDFCLDRRLEIEFTPPGRVEVIDHSLVK